MDVGPAKRALRTSLLERRAALSPEYVFDASRALVQRVQQSQPWNDAARVAAFVGVRNEPDTVALLQTALADGKALWLPRVMARHEIAFVRVRALTELAPGTFGLLEPPVRTDDPPQSLAAIDLDLVLVPGLAFARDGTRLGFGRGLYDRALAPRVDRDRPLRVGLCFSPFLLDERLPSEPFDVRMHAVVTEDRLVECG